MQPGQAVWALPEAVVFDLDATLTVGKHDFAALSVKLGLAPNEPILETVLAKPPAEREQLSAALAQWEWDIAEQTEAAAGAVRLLAGLSERGCRLAVLTRNRRDIALHTLEAAGLSAFFVPELVLGRDCATPKPDPAGIELIRRRWGVAPSPTAMVGDYVFDLQAGRAAGCVTVHVGAQARSDWSTWTDHHVADLVALAENWQLSR